MSQPPYHLRTNKAVERLLFIELLRKLDGSLGKNVEKYRYVSLGGPFLEDFGLMHSAFGIRDMLSLETERHVLSRQNLNTPYSKITLTLDSTTDFVRKFDAGKKSHIVWFDYEEPSWKQQIAESCTMLAALPPMSIFKITLSGKAESLGGTLEEKAAELNTMFEDYGPFTSAMMNKETICSTLFKIFRRAVAAAIPDSSMRCLRSLASYEYNDHRIPILTITILIGPDAQLRETIGKSRLKEWPFSGLSWHDPIKIAVPDLSLRERLAVNRLLPDASARTLLRKLKLELSKEKEQSLESMKQYCDFYRQIPQFLRFTI